MSNKNITEHFIRSRAELLEVERDEFIASVLSDPAEKMSLAWELTKQLYEFKGIKVDESEFHRSVETFQRRKS